MKYFEFGTSNPELLVILHGGGTSYRGAEPSARLLSQKYHVVLVAYDGFNPTEPDTVFQSPMDEAQRVGDYLVEHYGGKVDVLYGISYGCRILMEVLADPRLTITTTIADGMGLKDYPNIRSKLGKDIYCFFYTGLFYAVMGHPGPRRKKFLARIAGRSPEETDRILYGRPPGRAGRIRTTTSLAAKPTTPCLPAPGGFCGMASRAAWTKSCLPGWTSCNRPACLLR